MQAATAESLNGSLGEYRRDIDGLRAFAILSVILYHYGVPGFDGGFAGVDIFFVISGFLITGHIADEIGASRFSLLSFYERRVRRIFPALFFMITLVLLAAVAVQFPPDFARFTGLAIYVIPFLANIKIYHVAGAYSGAFAQSVPLLHTWSLAIEEQFYLLFPALMLVIDRFVWRRRWLIFAFLAVFSLLLCVVAARIAPLAAFYLLPFRAWELLTGALLAVGKFPPPQNPKLRSVLALVGLAMIAASDALLSNRTPFPSEYALLPCIGATLILYAACNSAQVVGRVLDNPVAVRIGLWSYSLYLFHWPLLVLAKYYAFEPLSFSARGLLLVMTFVLAALSWRFIEQPFRGGSKLFSRSQLYTLAVAAGIVLMLATTALQLSYSNPNRYTVRERGLFPVFTKAQIGCWDIPPEEIELRPLCKLGDATAPIKAILWGDSHAQALIPAVDAAFRKHHEAVTFGGQGGCPPLLDVQFGYFRPISSHVALATLAAVGLGPRKDCESHNDAVLHWVARHQIPTVILAGHWITYANTGAVDPNLALTDTQIPDNGMQPDSAAIFERGLARLLMALQRLHVRVFILDDAPQVKFAVPYAVASANRLNEHREFGITRTSYNAQQLTVTRIFAELQRKYPFEILRPEDFLCAGGACAVVRDGRSLYLDSEHLSPAGALIVQPAFETIWYQTVMQ